MLRICILILSFAWSHGIFAGTLDESIDSIVSAEGEFSESLIEPLIDLARERHEAGDLDAEIDALRRAQHIIHRNRGVHSLRQLGIVETLSRIHLDKEQPENANREQELLLYLAERNHGRESPENLPAMKSLAEWYMHTGQFHRARRLVRDAMDIVSQDGGSNDVRLVEFLLLSAKIRRLQRSSGGYNLVEQARDIVEAEDANVASDRKATVYAALGDAYTAGNKDDLAAAAYARVAELLGTEAADRMFETPRIIDQSRELNPGSHTRKDVFQREQDVFTSFDRSYRRLSREERLLLASTEPEVFTLSAQEPVAGYRLPDAHGDDTDKDELRVIGHPIRFVLSQLKQLLPYELQEEEALAGLVIEISLTVNADGNTSDIVVKSAEIPSKIRRLMRRAVAKAKFRPKIVDGNPVNTEHFIFTQRFDR